ncbi:hypothetical protein MATL_G00135380 [Megalops atlanticus]|uniref:CARD domain-containing protein n=1 Tax=Megalops atlanticus TaxID=7932 RepID=A0A9D3Q1J3_MEGAT|nr:hypothetical protein MATL_G00135380 [Megalops atlanticus]
MNSEVFQRSYNAELFHERSLRTHLFALSARMSSNLVETILNSLSSKKTVSVYESQMIRSQLTDMDKACHLMQTVIRKGRTACQMFYKLLESCDPVLFEKITGSPAKASAVETLQPLCGVVLTDRIEGAPTYIINIHDSTLNHCIIGSHNRQHIVTEQHDLLSSQASDHARREAGRCNCKCGHQGSLQPTPAPPSIQVNSSQLKYVIIGDHNAQTVQEAGEAVDEEEQELARLEE